MAASWVALNGDNGGSVSVMAAFLLGLCGGDIGGSATSLAASWIALFLISTTFLWEFECSDGTKVGLNAGRYCGKRRPDLYRTPHALQRVFGPIGPSLHCGVFDTSQWVHLFVAIGCCEEVPSISLALDSCDSFFFFFSFLLTGFEFILGRLDSGKSLDWASKWCDLLEVEEMGGVITTHGLMVEERERLVRVRAGM